MHVPCLIMQYSIVVFLSFFAPSYSSMITRLDHENFDVHVYAVSDPWIVGIGTKVSAKELERIYEETKDRINIGAISEEEYTLYLKLQGKDEAPSPQPGVMMYPFGIRIHKELRREGLNSPDTAVYRALASIPDVTNKLPNVVNNRNTELRNFIQEAYSMLPPKFPIVLFTDEGGIPIFYKQIALKFSSLFHFAVIERAPPATLAVYNVAERPMLLVLLAELPGDGSPRIRPIPYDKNAHGSMSYAHVMRFLYLAHKTFFGDLLKHAHRSSVSDFDIDDMFEPHFAHFPELTQQQQQSESTKEYSQESKEPQDQRATPNQRKCTEDIDVCLILIGKDVGIPVANSWNGIIKQLKSVKDKVVAHGKSIEVYEVDITCNEKLELTFDIYTGDLPIIMILRPKGSLYTIAIVDEITVPLDQYIEQALSGKIGHAKYKEIPKFTAGRCLNNQTERDGEHAQEKLEL